MTNTRTQFITDGEMVHEHERRTPRHGLSELQATVVVVETGLDLDAAAFDVDAFRRGMEVELEHGLRDPDTNVTDDPLISGKIACAHLKEFPDYYDRLTTMEQEAEASSFDR